MCGEHCTSPFDGEIKAGSSPRVRGTLQRYSQPCGHQRFIPACAGNTRTTISKGQPTTVHPRVCGEHQFSIDAALRSPGSSPRVRGTTDVWSEKAVRRIGSSPRVRGTLSDRNLYCILIRFIPACAGNTPDPAQDGDVVAVHPRRVRGNTHWSV